MRRLSCWIVVLLASLTVGFAQDAPLKSGPQPEAVLPGPFDALNINGKVAEGRQHCLVCQNALNPSVLVFAREPAAGKDGPLNDLLKKLDDTLGNHQPANLGGFAVFLSPHARSSVTEEANEDIDKLLDESQKRIALVDRLKTRAKPLQNLIVACYPEDGPKGYNVDSKAAVTVVLYDKLKVVANWAFAEDKLTEKDVSAMVKKIDETLADAKKKRK